MSPAIGTVTPVVPIDRPFMLSETQRRVDAMFAQLPLDATAVIVGYYDFTGKWRAGWAYRKPTERFGTFELETSIGQDIARGDVSGEVYFRWVGGRRS